MIGVPPPSSRRLSPVSLKYEYTSLESQHCICSPDGKQDSQLPVGQRLGDAQEGLRMKDLVGQRTDRVLSLSTAMMIWSAVTLPACVYTV